MLNSKGEEILKVLCRNAGESSIKELAEVLEISERSIRYELEKIDFYIENLKLKKLKRIFGGKIYFEEYKKFLTEELTQENKSEFVAEDRKEYLLFTCIFKERINLTKISEILSVSRTTIRNDIREIRKELLRNKLELKLLQQKGLMLQGEEIDIRKEQLKFLLKYTDLIFYSSMNLKTQKELLIEEYLKDVDLKVIKKFINYIQKILNKIISDEAYNTIAVYLLLTIIRIRKDKSLEKIANKEFLKETQEYKIILKAKKILESGYKIILEENEILQITDYFLGSHTYNFKHSYYDNWIDIDILVKNFIDNFNKKIDVDISKDKLLLEGILNHIKPTIYRLKNNIKLDNSIFLEVMHSYPQIYYNTKISLKDIEKYLGIEFSDDEVAFLTIYFKAAIDRNKYKNKNLKKVLVVCGHGYGTSKLLVQQLKEIYNIDIIKTIPRHFLEKTLKEKEVDLIITTVGLDKNITIPAVQVKSLLTEEDISNLDKYSLSKQRKKYMLSDLIRIIESNCNIENKERLIKELNCYFEQRLINDLEEKEYRLIDFLKPKNIKINVSAKTWQEAVRISGNILVENRITENKYVESMIENIEKIGPYVVIDENIAIPHSQSNKLVLKSGMGLVVLRKPVLFPKNKKVQVILSFSSKDNKEHLNALTELVELMRNYNLVEKIIKAKDIRSILRYLEFKD